MSSYFHPSQATIRLALGQDEHAGDPGFGMTDQQRADYYRNLAHGTGDYITGAGDLNAQAAGSTASSAEQIRQQLIAFGIIPEGYQDKYGWVNDETRQLAAQNTAAGTSTFARLQKAYADAARQHKRQLAARGMLNSGSTAYGMQEQALLQRQNLSDATSKLLGANQGVYNQYTNDFNARAQQWRDLERNANADVKNTPLPTAPGQTQTELQSAWDKLPLQPATPWNPVRGRLGMF